MVEFLEEHDELRRKTPSVDKKDDDTKKLLLSHKSQSMNNPHLTPNLNRKNSDYIMMEVSSNMKSMMGNKGAEFLIIGICGGQSCGKSLISLYLKKHLSGATIISEKDFFIGTKDRKKSLADEKMKILNMIEDDYSVNRKHRLVETNHIKCFDWEALLNVLTSLKKGEITSIPTWDKDKSVQIPNHLKINPKETKIIILEGQFLFYQSFIKDLLDYRIFVETDDDIRLARMVLKENVFIQDRAPAMKSFFTIYEDFIKPCYQKYIEPTKKHAHLILPNFSFNSSLEIVETTVLDFMVLNLQNVSKK